MLQCPHVSFIGNHPVPFIFLQVNMPMGDDEDDDEKVFYLISFKKFQGKNCVYYRLTDMTDV